MSDMNKPTLCWSCAKACKKCSWSRNFEPVKGWEAEPTTLQLADVYVMLEQLAMIASISDRALDDRITYKVGRLGGRLANAF